MNYLTFCFECSYRCKPRRTLPKSIIAIQKSNRKMNPKLAQFINQLINQKYA